MADDGVFAPFPGTDAECFIQWKGTTLCVDVYCSCSPEEPRHFDGDFAYFVQCDTCGAIYEMGTQVKLRKLVAGEEPAGQPVMLDGSD